MFVLKHYVSVFYGTVIGSSTLMLQPTLGELTQWIDHHLIMKRNESIRQNITKKK
jgi:hypothetical protein